VPQLLLVPAAELAAVVVAGEEERVRDLTAEAAGDVNEFDEADDGGAGIVSRSLCTAGPSASTISAL